MQVAAIRDVMYSDRVLKSLCCKCKHLLLLLACHRLVLASKLVALGLDTLLSPLARGLGLGTLGVHLLLELDLTGLLGLGLVDLYRYSRQHRVQRKIWRVW